MTPKRNPNDPPDINELNPIPDAQHPAGQDVNRDNPVPQPPPVPPSAVVPPPDGGPPTEPPIKPPPEMPPAPPAKGKK
jgi:hypothetical protein